MWSTSARRTTSTPSWPRRRSRPASTSSCEKPLAVDAGQARGRWSTPPRPPAVVAAVPFVYRYYPVVREARSGGRRGERPVHLIHGTYLQDWLLTPDDDNWRVDAALGGASRTFADIGSHWCDLAEFMSGHRITRLVARTLIVHPSDRATPTVRRSRRRRPAADGPDGRPPRTRP